MEEVDHYNFDALEGMELKVCQRLKAVNDQVMVVSEVPGPRHVSPNLSDSLSGADIVNSTMAVDMKNGGLTEGHDRASCMTDGDGVACYYEGDLGDSDCGSTGDHERDIWDDWCDSAFHYGYGGFPPDADDPQPPVMFSNQLFWDDDIAQPSRMWQDGENAPVSKSLVLVGTVMPLMPPDADRRVRLDNSELELLNSRIDEFSVLSMETGDTFMDIDALDGDALDAYTRNVGILDGDEGWLCLLYSTSSGSLRDTSFAVGLDCKDQGHCRACGRMMPIRVL